MAISTSDSSHWLDKGFFCCCITFLSREISQQSCFYLLSLPGTAFPLAHETEMWPYTSIHTTASSRIQNSFICTVPRTVELHSPLHHNHMIINKQIWSYSYTCIYLPQVLLAIEYNFRIIIYCLHYGSSKEYPSLMQYEVMSTLQITCNAGLEKFFGGFRISGRKIHKAKW